MKHPDRLTLIVLFSFVFFIFEAQSAPKKITAKLLTSEFIYETAPFPSCHASTIVETSEGWNVYMETSNQELSDWGKISIDNNDLNAIQPTILFHKDGSIQILCRSKEKKLTSNLHSPLLQPLTFSL